MKMKQINYSLTVLMLCSFCMGYAQQESQFINVVNNPYILNPAAGGLTDVINFEVSSRTQWLGYNGGPQTFMFTANSQVRFKKNGDKVLSEFNTEDKALFSNPDATIGKVKHVIGGRASNDAIGPFAKTSVFGSYAIHLPFTKKISFGVGLGVGWSNFRINQDRVVLFQEDDAAYSQFLGNSTGQNILDANAGIVFYDNHFVAGVSMTQLFKNKVTFADVATESFYNRHFFVTAKYRFDFDNKLSIEPSVITKLAENSPASLDLGVRFAYNRSAWLGVQYRTSNAIVFQVGANIVKNLYVAYGYEIATGKIRTASNGSHEIQLGFYLGKNRNIDRELKGKKKGDESI